MSSLSILTCMTCLTITTRHTHDAAPHGAGSLTRTPYAHRHTAPRLPFELVDLNRSARALQRQHAQSGGLYTAAGIPRQSTASRLEATKPRFHRDVAWDCGSAPREGAGRAGDGGSLSSIAAVGENRFAVGARSFTCRRGKLGRKVGAAARARSGGQLGGIFSSCTSRGHN